MIRQNLTKIIATLGPASQDKDILRQLHQAGADIFRLNFSHGSHDDHARNIANLRALESELGHPIAILADLQGPKLRVGKFKDGKVTLREGQSFKLDLSPELGDEARVQLPHPEILRVLQPGEDLLLDDGRLRLQVKEANPEWAICQVTIGGVLSNHKGVNVPGSILDLSPLTPKDRADLDFALDQGVDWVALSFVQRPKDILELKEIVKGRAWVMAKLEKPAAIHDLEAIVAATDAVMVARGDLGVEMPPERVPVIQRQIIACCRDYGRPVVVATQMLDSMVERASPTRAEASDVATAVYHAVDAVMLSAETAAGKYPREAVEMMHRIIMEVQADPAFWPTIDQRRVPANNSTPDAVSSAAREMAEIMPAALIAAYTSSGSTALRLARERPHAPIMALTPRTETARRLKLLWGMHAVRTPDAQDMEDMAAIATHQALVDGLAKRQQRIVITAGLPFGTPGKTNLIRVVRIA